MSPKRSTRPKGVALALEPVQFLVEAVASGLCSDHEVVRVVSRRNHEFRRRPGDAIDSAVAVEVREDGGFGLI